MSYLLETPFHCSLEEGCTSIFLNLYLRILELDFLSKELHKTSGVTRAGMFVVVVAIVLLLLLSSIAVVAAYSAVVVTWLNCCCCYCCFMSVFMSSLVSF